MRNFSGTTTEHPILKNFREDLDATGQEQFDSLIALIEAMLPTEALFYDMSNNAENVAAPVMEMEDFARNARMFFAALKQFKNDDEALEAMHVIEPYQTRWNETLAALGIEEQ